MGGPMLWPLPVAAMDDPHWLLIPYVILTLAGGKEAAESICKYFSPTTRVLLTACCCYCC